MNEQEALPLWKLFEDATGVKVNYVRSSDTQIMAKVAIENRAGQRTWDIAFTTTVPQLPADYLAQFDPPEAKGLMAEARDPNRRWYGGYANYNAPAYNTNFVQRPICRRLTKSSPRTRNGPARSPSTTPTTNGSRRFAPSTATRAARRWSRASSRRSTRSSPTAISRLRARSGPANIGWRSTTTCR